MNNENLKEQIYWYRGLCNMEMELYWQYSLLQNIYITALILKNQSLETFLHFIIIFKGLKWTQILIVFSFNLILS